MYLIPPNLRSSEILGIRWIKRITPLSALSFLSNNHALVAFRIFRRIGMRAEYLYKNTLKEFIEKTLNPSLLYRLEVELMI